MEFLDTALKLVLGLLALLVVTRLLGKKEMAQITPFDFVYALVLGGLLEESLYDKKITIWSFLFAVLIWAILIYIIEVIAVKNDRIKKILKGEPSVIVKNGQLDTNAMKKNHLEMEQLRTMLRQQGVFSLREVRDLYLEPSGNISIQKYSSSEPPTAAMLHMEVKDEAPSVLLIDEGKIKKEILQFAGKTTNWLQDELKKEGYAAIENIFFAEWSATDGFYIKTYDDPKECIRN
ncbi:DUF421 domain-containing protein [Lederbergia lenta]|uniref:Protein of uncharacterized function (DUF421) n=1 Tax=Lederbergia lenta TaxID=1467 RepID=A0A2X4VHL0_LEDLE|nr:DUF421 domain-containing protein [Lederbergia lenta]MCM3112614.1 DUF421 domain-containing protein [Lederbergia lenta]MEC2323652.1 DUF421 domain-containing protein [Lederbergia lenta]SQI51717.1 Protein of uncharacterised function (DUF421) [Lederbergia lenta]